MIELFLVVTSVSVLFDIHTFNRLFDHIVPVYTILAILAIYAFKKSLKAGDEETNPERSYKFSKKGKGPLTWKQKFAGTWNKIERTQFYEFMVFNGAPSFVAQLKKDADFGQVLVYKDGPEPSIKVTATGFPSGDGPMVKIGPNKDTTFPTDYQDLAGKKFTQVDWWEEETKTLCIVFKYHSDGSECYQTRQVTDDDVLLLTSEMRKPDGSKQAFHAKFKRM